MSFFFLRLWSLGFKWLTEFHFTSWGVLVVFLFKISLSLLKEEVSSTQILSQTIFCYKCLSTNVNQQALENIKFNAYFKKLWHVCIAFI